MIREAVRAVRILWALAKRNLFWGLYRDVYRLLETEVVPRCYHRDLNGLPHRWVAVMKRAIRTIAPQFSARRMLKEYVSR